MSAEPAASGRASVLCIYGMGGIGKTTVAQWLMWRPEIEARFPDGRIFETLGRTPPKRAELLSRVLGKLRRDIGPTLTEEAAGAALAAILRTKAILIVIDDVWPEPSAETASALIVASPNSRFLVTTRSAKLASDWGGTCFPVDEMTDEEAACLVAVLLRRTLTADERQHVARLQSLVHVWTTPWVQGESDRVRWRCDGGHVSGL